MTPVLEHSSEHSVIAGLKMPSMMVALLQFCVCQGMYFEYNHKHIFIYFYI